MIRIYSDILANKEIDKVLSILPDKTQYKLLGHHEEIEKWIVEEIFPKLDLPLISSGIVSANIDSTPVCIHLDSYFSDETHKLLVYLTDTGSTLFYDKYGNFISEVPSKVGTCVLFDMSLLHKGGLFPSDKLKKTVGLRVKICEGK